MAKIGRPRKKGRPKGKSMRTEKEANAILRNHIAALQDCIKAKDQAIEIFTKFEGMIFAIHDKVRALEDKLKKITLNNGETK